MQFSSDNPALRTHLQSQVDFMNEFTQKMYDTLRQVSEMNLKLAHQVVEGSIHASREMLNCTDPMQFAQVAMKQVQPATERIRTYQQHLLGVLAGAQADFTHAAQTRMPEAGRGASAVAGEMVRNAGAAMATPNGPAVMPAGGNGSANDMPHIP